MAISIDAVITKDGGGNQESVTTDPFTPEAGRLLVAGASSYASSGDDSSSLAITDSLGLTWTKHVERSQGDDGSGINPPPVAMWTAVATGAEMTVTSSRVDGVGYNHTVTVHILDEADTSDPVVATGEQSTSGAMQVSVDTTGVDNCLLIGRMVDWSNTTNVPVEDANSTTDYAIATATIQANWAGHRAVGAGGTYTVGTSSPSSGTTTNAIAVAIRPAAGGSTVAGQGTTAGALTTTATGTHSTPGTAAARAALTTTAAGIHTAPGAATAQAAITTVAAGVRKTPAAAGAALAATTTASASRTAHSAAATGQAFTTTATAQRVVACTGVTSFGATATHRTVSNSNVVLRPDLGVIVRPDMGIVLRP